MHFAKYTGCGNDFILIDGRSHPAITTKQISTLCDRHQGIGADGVILLERSQKALLKMTIYNQDGSQAEMCGNGIRCLHHFAGQLHFPSNLQIETPSGIYTTSETHNGLIAVQMTAPKLGISSYTIEGITCDATFTGVPHLVCQVENVLMVDVQKMGRLLRFHPTFKPSGTNVNFVQIESADRLLVRTYERGVERETLACGTGAIAAAYVHSQKERKLSGERTIEVKTRSGESLITEFFYRDGEVTSLKLIGPARKVFEGNIVLD